MASRGRKGVMVFELDLIDIAGAVGNICSGKGTAADLQNLIDAGARLIRVEGKGLIVDGYPVTDEPESISRLIDRLN